MSVQVQTIYGRVRTQLIDTGATPRWTDQELINWICDGSRALVAVLPRASAKRVVIPMVAGTRQSIPTDGYTLLRVYRNMGASGATPGIALVKQPSLLMDTQYPTWHEAPAVKCPSVYVFDPADPTTFWVSGPSDGTGQLEISYSVMPGNLSNPTDLIQVQDIWQTALFDYCMWRAQQKDSDYAAGMAAAQQYFSSFSGLLGNLGRDTMTQATMEAQT
ncbi:MAG: phage adaptor protein [Caldimonas sp.]